MRYESISFVAFYVYLLKSSRAVAVSRVTHTRLAHKGHSQGEGAWRRSQILVCVCVSTGTCVCVYVCVCVCLGENVLCGKEAMLHLRRSTTRWLYGSSQSTFGGEPAAPSENPTLKVEVTQGQVFLRGKCPSRR
jgi:hypothetical protein